MAKKHYRFETAAYSYFLMVNYEEQKKKFLAGEISNPSFKYHERFSQRVINERLEKVAGDREASRSLQFVGLACALQKNDRLLGMFRRTSSALYGKPEAVYYDKILALYAHNAAVARVAERSDNAVFREMIEHGLGLKRQAAVDAEVYRRFRGYFRRYFGEVPEHESMREAMEFFFRKSGLKEKGWELKLEEDLVRARVVTKRKEIGFGRKSRLRGGTTAYNSVAVHEIFGHAVRETGLIAEYDLEESEGWAVMLEQLCEGKFRFRRTYRYLAGALGWGCWGEPLDFRCTWEALWRLMSLSERYGDEEAKNHAFDETARVFRGGRPDVAGAVFLKDLAYFKGNMDVWRYLERHVLDYEDFVDILEGRRKILR